MSPNKLVLSLEGNDSLREKMATVAPGDEIEMEVTVKLDESTGEQAQFSVVEANIMEVETPETEGEGEMGEMAGEMEEGGEMGKEEEGDAAAILVFGKGGKARA